MRSGGRGSRPPAARRYGQHHLVDRGTLEAIVALADVRSDDVVLEVGAADGVLTGRLLDTAAHVHAFEIDRRFAAALEELANERPGLSVHPVDALKADLTAMRPVPTKLVANLAYNIAIPLIMRSIDQLPLLERWAVMVQKELADRLFARPSTKAYSAVSVLVQLACRRVASRPVPRTVFSPRPRVDSVFVVFERRPGEHSIGDEGVGRSAAGTAAGDGVGSVGAGGLSVGRREVERTVRAAFAQRRKMLANALSGVALCGSAVTPGDVRSALERMGLPVTSRAEELSPDRFPELARLLAGPTTERRG